MKILSGISQNFPTILYCLPQDWANGKDSSFVCYWNSLGRKGLVKTIFRFPPENGIGREAIFLDIYVLLTFLRLNEGGIGTLTPEARREVASSHTDFHDSFPGHVVSWRLESQGRQTLSVAFVIFSIQHRNTLPTVIWMPKWLRKSEDNDSHSGYTFRNWKELNENVFAPLLGRLFNPWSRL